MLPTHRKREKTLENICQVAHFKIRGTIHKPAETELNGTGTGWNRNWPEPEPNVSQTMNIYKKINKIKQNDKEIKKNISIER